MKFFQNGSVKTAVIAGGVAAVTAGILAGGPALAKDVEAATAASPAVVTGYRAGPLNFSTTSTLGKLHLKAGNWVIIAKAWLVSTSDFNVYMDCTLTAGNGTDTVRPTIPPGDVQQTGQAMTLNLVRSFGKSGGNAVFSCESFGAQMQANGIRITAIQAGKVTNETLGG
jgi:hypothetical protein